MPNSTAFDDHLTVGESTVTDGSGALFQEVRWTSAEICVTDRRVLFVPAEGGFVDVPRHQVQSIRSRPTTRRANHEIAALGMLAGGIAVAAVAIWATFLAATSLLIPLFTLLGAAGTLATTAIVARDLTLDADDVASAVDRVDDGLGAIDAGLAGIDDALTSVDERLETGLGDVAVRERVDVHHAYEPRVAEAVETHPVARWAAAGLGVLGAAGLLLLGAWVALGLTAMAAVGVASAIHGLEHVRALDAAGQRIRRQRSVCLYLVDGRTVRFRIDDDADIDRELSRLTARTPDGALPSANPEGTGAGGAGEPGTGERGTGENGSGKRGTGKSGA